jgi:hypothetical protein
MTSFLTPEASPHVFTRVCQILLSCAIWKHKICLPGKKKTGDEPQLWIGIPMCDQVTKKTPLSLLAAACLHQRYSLWPAVFLGRLPALACRFLPFARLSVECVIWRVLNRRLWGTSSLPPSDVCPSFSCFTLHPLNPPSIVRSGQAFKNFAPCCRHLISFHDEKTIVLNYYCYFLNLNLKARVPKKNRLLIVKTLKKRALNATLLL